MRDTQRAWMTGVMLILLVLTILGAATAQVKPALSTPIWFATEVSIEPDEDADGLWHCEALLTDLGSNEALSAPTIVFAAGEKASVQSGLPSEMLWELGVEVSDDGANASWSSKMTLGDQVLSVSTGSVRLARD